MLWQPGQAIVRREVLRHGIWLGTIVFVVEDRPDLLVSYLPEGAPFGFPAGDWPTPDGHHPWHGKPRWEGHGTLMLQRPGDAHAVWHFWHGPRRTFAGWYLNLQDPFRRTTIGYDRRISSLDIWVRPDGRWHYKDLEVMPDRVAEGRWTEDEVAEIIRSGERLGARLDAGERWWDERWADWSPDPAWRVPDLPEGWERI